MSGRRFAVMAALALTHGSSALAQQWPADSAYSAWPCDTSVMTDPYHDESGAQGPRDLVGSDAAPAGLRATDAGFLYVRLRLDQDPAVSTFAWALLVDTNNDASLYDVMLGADNNVGTVSIYRNTTGTPGDPRDAPDLPAVSSLPWSSRARSIVAPGSSYGSDADYFLDLAYSWADLAAVGIGPSTPMRVWAATSTALETGLNGDFACRAGYAPTLENSWIVTTPDPSQGPYLAGGGGCAHGTAGVAALLALVPLLALAWRRARRGTSPGR